MYTLEENKYRSLPKIYRTGPVPTPIMCDRVSACEPPTRQDVYSRTTRHLPNKPIDQAQRSDSVWGTAPLDFRRRHDRISCLFLRFGVENRVLVHFGQDRIDVNGVSEGCDGCREAVAGVSAKLEHCVRHVRSELRLQPRRSHGCNGAVELTEGEHEAAGEN